MNRRVLPVSLAVVALVLVLTILFVNNFGSTESAAGKVVQVYYADNISPAHRIAIERFNAMYSGRIEVVPVSLPFEKFSTNERKELLARSLRNKSDRLDIFTVDHIWVPRFSRWCEPLDDRIPLEERRAILPQAEASCIYDSTLMAIPTYIDIGMLYYRRDLVQKARPDSGFLDRLDQSITWEEFRTLGREFRKVRRPFYFFPADDYEGLTCHFFELIAGQDDRFFLRRPLDFSGPEARRALTMLVEFVRKDGITPPAVEAFDEIRCYDGMLDSDGVFVRGWPNFIESYRTKYRDQDKLGLLERAPLPHFAGRRPVTVFGGWNLMVSQYSTRKDEAVTFARFFQREDIQKVMFEVGGYIPTNLNVYRDSLYVSQHPVLRFYIELIKTGFHRPSLVEYTKMSDIISRSVNRAIRGEEDVTEALQRASREIQEAGATR